MLQSKFKQINLNAYSDVMTTENIYKGTMGLNLNVTLEWHVYCVVNVETWLGLFLNFLTSFGLSTGSTNKLKLFQTSKLLQNTVWKCWKFKVFVWCLLNLKIPKHEESNGPSLYSGMYDLKPLSHLTEYLFVYRDTSHGYRDTLFIYWLLGHPACRLKMVLMF